MACRLARPIPELPLRGSIVTFLYHWGRNMETSIRDLKAHLSEYIRRAAAGESVSVSVHRKVVARIVSSRQEQDLAALQEEAGIRWAGGKPAGLADAESMPDGVQLSDWIAEDRR
jgi:prevent-host-death family protein